MITMFILFGICIWVLGFINFKLLESSCVLSGLRLLLCSNLCLFDAIVELHAMDENLFNDFLIGK